MTLLLLWAAIQQVVAAFSWGHESFQLTEWLINYSGGFVRRGLPGELLGIASRTTGIQANQLIILVSAAIYLILAIWLLRRSTRTFPSILVLSCIVMGFPAYQDSIIRKDCLGLLLLLACLKIDGSRLPRALAFTGINIVAVAAILSHEAFAFYGLPALVFLRARNDNGPDLAAVIRRSMALLPAALCFLLTALFHGTPQVAESVNDSWLALWRTIDPANPGIGSPSAAIEALGWNSKQGLSLGVTLLTSGFYQPLAWACVFAISFVLFLIFTGRDHERSLETKTRVTAILLFQLVFISPLFLLGFDYGRWLFFWLASTIIIETESRSTHEWMQAAVAELFRKSKADLLLVRVPVRDWYLLFFGVPVVWNKFNFIDASPVSRHILQLWSWL